MERAEHRTIRIIVQGNVQGVGFRWFTRQVAQELGIRGTVANLRDGTVQIVARGSEDALQRLQYSVGQGPPHSGVSHLNIQDCPEIFVGAGFEIVHAP